MTSFYRTPSWAFIFVEANKMCARVIKEAYIKVTQELFFKLKVLEVSAVFNDGFKSQLHSIIVSKVLCLDNVPQ